MFPSGSGSGGGAGAGERGQGDGRPGVVVAQAAEEVAEKEPKAAAELNVGEPAELVVVEVSEVEEVDEVGQDVDLLPSL